VTWNYSDAYKARIEAKTKGTPREGRWRRFIAERRAKTGYEGKLAISFSMSADELAGLMERMRVQSSSVIQSPRVSQ
jgi:hypothetical protein